MQLLVHENQVLGVGDPVAEEAPRRERLDGKGRSTEMHVAEKNVEPQLIGHDAYGRIVYDDAHCLGTKHTPWAVGKKNVSHEGSMAPFIRTFLAVARTTLQSPVNKQRYPFDGLFTTRKLKRGDFLGFYNGTYKDLDGREYRGRHDYVFIASDGYFVPRRHRVGGTLGVDAERYPMAMLNEPPALGHANVVAVEVTKAKNAIPHLPSATDVAAIAFYACTSVPSLYQFLCFLYFQYISTQTHPRRNVPRELYFWLEAFSCSRK